MTKTYDGLFFKNSFSESLSTRQIHLSTTSTT